MHIDRSQIWHAGLFTLRHIASAVVIFGIVGFLAKPHAQQFVEDTVNDRLNLLEMQMNDVRQSVRDQERVQDVMKNDISHIKEDQDETQRNTRMILRSLNGLRSDMRAE